MRRRREVGLTLALSLLLAGGCGPAAEAPVLGTPLDAERAARTTMAVPTQAPLKAGYGLLTVIPESSGSTFSPEALRAGLAAGARYQRVSLDWADSEPQPGELSFSTGNDKRIQQIEQAGMRVFPTLYVGRGWMNADPPDARHGGSRSYPPADLGTEWSDEYGFSRGYYNFVRQFFTYYRGHFDYVAIENEATSALFWGGTAEEYVRLIRTAYKAVKEADPQVVVIDSGFVSNLWGLCIAEDALQAGTRPREEVVQAALEYYRAETNRIRIQSEADLVRLLAQDRVLEQCRRARSILLGVAGSVDAVNFHFYEDYRVMPSVVAWIRGQTELAGYTPGVVTNELGLRGADLPAAEGDAHAARVFKQLVTARALGVQAIVWFSADTIGKSVPSPDKIGLFGPAGEMRPAAQAFRVVAENLSPELRPSAAPSVGNGLFHYVFEDAAGQTALEALWDEDGQQPVVLRLPPGRSTAVRIDYLGRERSLTATDGTVMVEVGEDPCFVLWS